MGRAARAALVPGTHAVPSEAYLGRRRTPAPVATWFCSYALALWYGAVKVADGNYNGEFEGRGLCPTRLLDNSLV